MPSNVSKMYSVKLSNDYFSLDISDISQNIKYVNNLPFSSYLRNLTILECCDSVWMNDSAFSMIAITCRQLKAVNLSYCRNFRGLSLHRLLTNCTNLKTLILYKTGIVKESLLNISDWSKTGIIELNLSGCYYIDSPEINHTVCGLSHQLEYLCCPITEVILLKMLTQTPHLRTLEMRRRDDVDVELTIKCLLHCTSLEHVDLSLSPLDDKEFLKILPKLPKLKWINISGHAGLKTSHVISHLAKYCKHIETIIISYYQNNEDDSIINPILDLISQTSSLKCICIQGASFKNMVKKIRRLIASDENLARRRVTLLDSANDVMAKIPPPRNSLIRYNEAMKKFYMAYN